MDNKEFKEARKLDLAGSTMSASIYNLVMGAVLIWGVLVNILMAQFYMDEILSMNYIVMIIIYFIGSIGSMFIVYRSKNPVISFLAFNGLSISMGLILVYFVAGYDVGSITLAFITTAVVTMIMTVLATAFPNFFLGLGRVLFCTLCISIVVELLVLLFTGTSPTIFDFIVVVIFCGYVGYDFAKAQEYKRTLDNAIDSAADIYIDVVNLFVRILSIMGKRK